MSSFIKNRNALKVILFTITVLFFRFSISQQIELSKIKFEKKNQEGFLLIENNNINNYITVISDNIVLIKSKKLKKGDTIKGVVPNKPIDFYIKDSLIQKILPIAGDNIFSSKSIASFAGGGTISWSLNYDAYYNIKKFDPQAKIIIKWNTEIGAKRNKKNYAGSEWSQIELPLNKTTYKLTKLRDYESYKIKIGIISKGNTYFSSTQKFKTKRTWGVAKILILLGSLAFFIYGMKVMSDGLQQAAGGRLRKLLGLMTGNRFKGILTGLGITSIVQSSSVTTVMTVSFVNAGLMSLRQSAGVMLGANIGTTLTAWLILIIGFKVKVDTYAFMIMAISAPLLFIKRGNSRSWLSVIFGFCILFVGLSALKDSVPEMTADHPFVRFFFDFQDKWYGPTMFMLLGTIVTVIIQSSSAAMAVTLTLVSKGIIPFDVACAMILGENIGTTITAELAALVANVHAKRAARVHFLFNVVGVIWALILINPFKLMIEEMVAWESGKAFNSNDFQQANTGIALFHTMFNIINVLVMVWFIPFLVKLSEKMVKSKGDSDEEFHLDYIGGGIVTSPDISLLEAQKELAKFGKITSRMKGFIIKILNSSDKKLKQKMFVKLKKYEEITDRVEEEITNYIGKTSRLQMNESASLKMRGILSITTDLERIGDIFYQMGKTLEKKEQEKIWFSPEQRTQLNEMLELIEQAFEIMNTNLNGIYGQIDMEPAMSKENEINKMRDKLRSNHLLNLEDEDYNTKSGLIFTDLFSSCEKVGDHIINVSEAVSGEFGKL